MKRRLLLCALMFIIFFPACKTLKIKNQIEKLTSIKIVIPSDINHVLMGHDTILSDRNVNIARLIIYFDSLTCSPCRLKYMYEYNDILAEHEETNKVFLPMFIFSPRKGYAAEIRNTLLLYRFDYPVLLDERRLFPAANPHIPADQRFHTFLLDKNGKVVLVGDPVHNPKLWELYKTTITQLIENGGILPD